MWVFLASAFSFLFNSFACRSVPTVCASAPHFPPAPLRLQQPPSPGIQVDPPSPALLLFSIPAAAAEALVHPAPPTRSVAVLGFAGAGPAAAPTDLVGAVTVTVGPEAAEVAGAGSGLGAASLTAVITAFFTPADEDGGGENSRAAAAGEGVGPEERPVAGVGEG